MATGTPLPATFGWSDGSIGLTIEVDAAGTARVVRLGGSGSGPPPAPGSGPSRDGTATAGLPLVDVVLAGEGRAWSGRRYCESVTGPRLRYRGHEDRAEAGGHVWQVPAAVRSHLRGPVQEAIVTNYRRRPPYDIAEVQAMLRGGPTP